MRRTISLHRCAPVRCAFNGTRPPCAPPCLPTSGRYLVPRVFRSFLLVGRAASAALQLKINRSLRERGLMDGGEKGGDRDPVTLSMSVDHGVSGKVALAYDARVIIRHSAGRLLTSPGRPRPAMVWVGIG